MILALARHIFEHGTDGRFYSQIRKYHHEGGKVYWFMNATPGGRHPHQSLRRGADLRGATRSRHPSETIIPPGGPHRPLTVSCRRCPRFLSATDRR